jgi:hypothetical protein
MKKTICMFGYGYWFFIIYSNGEVSKHTHSNGRNKSDEITIDRSTRENYAIEYNKLKLKRLLHKPLAMDILLVESRTINVRSSEGSKQDVF